MNTMFSDVSPKPHGHTRGYEGWPEDVRDQIIAWNRERRLSFLRHRKPFQCVKCKATCESNPNGDATVWAGSVGLTFCDDCLIAAARPVVAALNPETWPC
jgi:hypothetical protein